MNDSFNNIYDGFFSLLIKMDSLSPQEREKEWDHFVQLGLETKKKLDGLMSEFELIRQQNKEYDSIIQSLHDNLDQQSALIKKDDYELHKANCAEKFRPFWDDLEESSKEFLATADYIYDYVMARNNDFSPVIIEYCRAFENELDLKLFSDFIIELSSEDSLIVDFSGNYSKLQEAIKDNKKNNKYFLSATSMIRYLSYMRNNETGRFGYNYELQKHLESKGYLVADLSSAEFEERATDYIDNFRNKAAHPFVFHETEAKRCRERTKKLVKTLISATAGN